MKLTLCAYISVFGTFHETQDYFLFHPVFHLVLRIIECLSVKGKERCILDAYFCHSFFPLTSLPAHMGSDTRRDHSPAHQLNLFKHGSIK